MISHDADEPAVLAAMLAFAEEAGALALDLRAAGLNVSHKGDLGQALTEADTAISRMLHARFGPRLIEEETAAEITFEAARALLAEDSWTFIGDPIDGTKPFAGGLAGWGTMIAACRLGRPTIGVMNLPAWVDERDRLDAATAPAEQRGLLLAASTAGAFWAPTRHGRMTQALRPLEPPNALTHHVGWLPIAASHYTLDYRQGLFPWCESSYVADIAALATGRLDATTFNHKLWDLAPTLPLLRALGFGFHRWPGLEAAPEVLIDLFDSHFACDGDLWLVSRERETAARLARAIRRAEAGPASSASLGEPPDQS